MCDITSEGNSVLEEVNDKEEGLVMNWHTVHSPFSVSAFTPRVSSTTLDSSPSTDSSPEQVIIILVEIHQTYLTSPFPSQLKLSGASGSSGDSDVPLSRTHTYKKITKPLLERKRRARINKCLDELKDIMTGVTIRKPARNHIVSFQTTMYVAALDIF